MKIYKERLFLVGLICTLAVLFSACSSVRNGQDNKRNSKEISVLVVGGGSSHDFDKWYKEVDVQTLNAANMKASYVDDVSQILPLLANIDVLFLTNNQPINDLATRQAIFDFVAAGNGLVLGHAALWYNWEDWPEYNKNLVSGGSRGHDAYGSFQVKVLDTNHPVTKGVSQSFTLKDELYYFKEDAAGPGIEVLATASKEDSGEKFPSVFIVKNPDARIVGLALGHDAESHDIKEYQSLLINAIRWVSRR